MAKRSTSSSSTPAPGADTRLCVLHGPEEMLKRELLDQLRAAMAAAHHEVETLVFDGRAAPLADVLDELRSFGLMQQHKIVIVDEADAFVTAHREALERYAANPVDNATLVFRSVKWNKGNLDKLIAKFGFVARCDPPSPADAARWAVQRAASVHQRKLEPAAAGLLVDRLGADLMKLDAELAKLALLVEAKEPIGRPLVEEVVGRSSDEEAWAVQEALLSALAGSGTNPGNPGASPGANPGGELIKKVYELVNLSGQPDVLVTYFIADMVRKLHVGLMMKQQGVSESQIARDMKLWGPRQGMFMTLLHRLDAKRAYNLFNRVVELDVRSKTGRGNALRNLECFCASLADGIR